MGLKVERQAKKATQQQFRGSLSDTYPHLGIEQLGAIPFFWGLGVACWQLSFPNGFPKTSTKQHPNLNQGMDWSLDLSRAGLQLHSQEALAEEKTTSAGHTGISVLLRAWNLEPKKHNRPTCGETRLFLTEGTPSLGVYGFSMSNWLLEKGYHNGTLGNGTKKPKTKTCGPLVPWLILTHFNLSSRLVGLPRGAPGPPHRGGERAPGRGAEAGGLRTT